MIVLRHLTNSVYGGKVMSNETVLRMANIDKRFGGVHALDNVTFEVRKGEVHVLMGENGAGKSTLMKILDGLYSADTGEIYLDGEKVEIDSPIKAKELGVAMIHQELSMCTNMTIAENIYRGEEPTGALGFVNYKKLYADAQKVLDDMGMALDAHMPVGELSIAQQTEWWKSPVLFRIMQRSLSWQRADFVFDGEGNPGSFTRIVSDLESQGRRHYRRSPPPHERDL